MSQDDATADTPVEQPAPFLQVVRGDATPEELAALVTVLSAVRTAAPAAPTRRTSWSMPSRLHRRTLPHGPGGWRSSGLPS